MSNILIDTDVVIEWLRGNEPITNHLAAIKNSSAIIHYSPVTKAEIYHGLRPAEENKTIDFFLSCTSLAVNDVIAEKAGWYLSRYHKSYSLALGDALIAATCTIHKLALFTLNKKHYPMPELMFINL